MNTEEFLEAARNLGVEITEESRKKLKYQQAYQKSHPTAQALTDAFTLYRTNSRHDIDWATLELANNIVAAWNTHRE